MYSFTSRVRFSECDKTLKLSISALINYFQDTSTFQCEELGIGFSYLKEKKAAWVLSYWHIEIHRMPKLGEEIELQTWPYEFKGFMASRNFVMKGVDGEILANANTLWSYIDTEKKRLKKIDQHQIEIYKMSKPFEMPEIQRKIAIPKDAVAYNSFEVVRYLLDSNEHVNNEKYISIASMYLPEEVEIKNIRTEYKMPAVLGD